MALSTEVRAEVAAALRPLGVAVVDHVPSAPTFPSLVLLADSPYLTRLAVAPEGYTVNLKVAVLVKAHDNRAAIVNCEDLVDQVLHALAVSSSAEWSEVSPPALQDFGAQGSGYVAEITLTRPARKA